MLLSRIAYSAGKLVKGEYTFRKRKGGIIMEPQKALPEHKQAKELPEHKQAKALMENNPRHQEHINE
jgi:hypothetical protein